MAVRVRPVREVSADVLPEPIDEPEFIDEPEPVLPEPMPLMPLMLPLPLVEPEAVEPEPIEPDEEPEPVEPAVPGVPVMPIGVPCVLCCPAPVGAGLAGFGGVLWAIAVPMKATAATPANRPLRFLDAVMEDLLVCVDGVAGLRQL